MGASDAGGRIVQFGISRSLQAHVALGHRLAEGERRVASPTWAGPGWATPRLDASAPRRAEGRAA